MVKYRIMYVLLALVFSLPFVTGGCSDDDGQEIVDPTVSLAGTYDLVSITFEGQPTLGPPVAFGSLVLTETTYQVQITIAVPGDTTQNIVDNGTYQISGTSWNQESAVQSIQSEGTFSLEGDILTVSVVTAGMQVENVWRKTG